MEPTNPAPLLILYGRLVPLRTPDEVAQRTPVLQDFPPLPAQMDGVAWLGQETRETRVRNETTDDR